MDASFVTRGERRILRKVDSAMRMSNGPTASPQRKYRRPEQFALTAAVFEASLTALAIALGWLLASRRSERSTSISPCGLGVRPRCRRWGALAVPGMSVATLRDDYPHLRRVLGPMFGAAGWRNWRSLPGPSPASAKNAVRGVIQPAVAEAIGGPRGVSFGLWLLPCVRLLHSITPTYAILAGLIGLYLGWIWLACGNLLTPMVTHGVYDFLALAYLVKVVRGPGPAASGEG